MAVAAIEQNRLSQFRSSRNQAIKKKRPVLKARSGLGSRNFTNRTRPQVQSVDNEQMYNQSKSPEARAQLEAEHKQAEMQRRNQERIKRDAYKMPKDLNEYISELADPGKDYVQGMYENELDSQGMDKLLDQQFGRTPLRTTKMVLAREKEKIKKAAMDAVKKQAKKALQEAFKQGLKGGKQVFTKTFWSSFAQGSIVEAEGAILETWFGSGTATGSYQALISVLHGGKKLLGEKGVISFIEPDPFKLPSQTMKLDAKSIATSGGTNILIGIYDLFGLVILTPLYILLLVAIFIIINLLLINIIAVIGVPLFYGYQILEWLDSFF